jgi:hypothetical protein
MEELLELPLLYGSDHYLADQKCSGATEGDEE